MLVFIDTETGGLEPSNTSLLSVALVVYDPKTKTILSKKEILVRHDPYAVSAGALAINEINLIDHHQRSYKPKQVIEMIQEFLYPYFKDKQAKLAGHNAPFDISYLKTMFMGEGKLDLFNQLFSHRAIDTIPIAQFLKDTGHIKLAQCGLSDLIAYFKIQLQGGRHTAMADALATVEVYQKMIDLIKVPEVPESHA